MTPKSHSQIRADRTGLTEAGYSLEQLVPGMAQRQIDVRYAPASQRPATEERSQTALAPYAARASGGGAAGGSNACGSADSGAASCGQGRLRVIQVSNAGSMTSELNMQHVMAIVSTPSQTLQALVTGDHQRTKADNRRQSID